MKLIKPSVEIVSASIFPLQLIEKAGRTCYKSEDKITDISNQVFVKKIIANGHEAVLEHASVTAKFICDRGVSHEIVRHRIASYCQESTRYCDYDKGQVCFVIPPWVDIKEGIWDSIRFQDERVGECVTEDLWLASMLCAEQGYQKLRKQGWSPQQARSVLPNSLKTEIVMTANLREWRTFFKQRTAKAAHPQMREVAIPLLEKMKEIIPIVFDDIEIKGE